MAIDPIHLPAMPLTSSTPGLGLIQPPARLSMTAVLVALARRAADPEALALLAHVPDALEAFSEALSTFALDNGIVLPPHLDLPGKHRRLLSKIASRHYDRFYEARVRTVDAHIQAWHAENQHQGIRSIVLVLGAGFDTKCLRLASAKKLTLVEFDTAITQALKRQTLTAYQAETSRASLPVAHVSVDYTLPKDALRQLQNTVAQLKAEVNCAPLSFFVTLEGLSYYLTQKDNQRLFHELALVLPAGTTVFVDWYRAAPWNPAMHPYGRFLASLGEPVHFTTDDYAADIVDAGSWTEIDREDRATAAAHWVETDTGRFSRAIALDTFGSITQFSRFQRF